MTPHTIVLTGATRGCGRALAGFLAARGHRIAGCGSNAPLVADLRAQLGTEHDFAAVDLRDDAAVRAWAGHVLERFGAPDLLVNNAGVIAPSAPLWTQPDAEIARVLDVNVRGIASVIRHFVPAMIARGRGVIVNFSSGWGRSTSPDVAIYCASKWAIEGLTQALAQELPAGLAAVALNPGIIDTDMLRSCFGSGAGQYPSPAEWAQQAGPFLLTLGPRHNGQSLNVPRMPMD